MSQFTSPLDAYETIDARTPCCDEPVPLGYRPFVHAGRPRRRDDRSCVWNVVCPACKHWQRVMVGFKLSARRAEASTGYETVCRPLATHVWYERDADGEWTPRA